MIQALAGIGLLMLLLFIFIGIPLIIWTIANIMDKDSEKALFNIFITANMILAMILWPIIFNFIDNPEQFGYQKIQTEKTTEVNGDGKN